MGAMAQKRVYEVTKALPLQFLLKMVETGKLRPGVGIFIGEKISYETLQQLKPATEVDVPQTEIVVWADVARACWSSHPDSRPSAHTTHEIISALTVGSDD